MTHNSKNYCMGCMKEMPAGVTICPHCSHNELSPQNQPFLRKGSIIYERYLVGKVESFASDSTTYIGLDLETEQTVSVIEFYPDKIASRPPQSTEIAIKLGYEESFRVALQSFLDLWNDMKEFAGIPCLPQVTDVLLFGGTAYAICQYKDKITLESYFMDREPLPAKKAFHAFKPIMSALRKLHSAGIIHGAISPKSICVGADGKLHLSRFSIRQCYCVDSALRSKPISGFAPIELYGDCPHLREYTDVYALTAVIYYAVTGKVPDDATRRAVKDDMVLPSAVAEKLTKNEISAIVKGLAVNPANRISSVAELMSLLYANHPASPGKSAASGVAPKARVTAENRQAPVRKPPKTIPLPEKRQEMESEISAPAPKKQEKEGALVALMIKTFALVVLGCFLVFSVLYTTVLYKSYDIPAMNKIFSAFSFLPMNKQDMDDEYENNLTSTADHENSYATVPDFTKYTQDDIKANETFNRNFQIEFKTEYTDKYPVGTVMSQSLTEGESVVSGTKIVLTVSGGPEQIELPDVIGMTYDEAAKKLTDKGFKVKKDVQENDGSQPVDEVFMMNKVAGLSFDIGSEVVLSVYGEIGEKNSTTAQASGN